MTQEFLGYLIGLDESNVNRLIRRVELLLVKEMHIKKDRSMTNEKVEIAISESGQIVNVSKVYPVSVNDITVHRKSDKLARDVDKYCDSGYQGLQNESTKVKLSKACKHSFRCLDAFFVIIVTLTFSIIKFFNTFLPLLFFNL